jgi:hypothetical protein
MLLPVDIEAEVITILHSLAGSVATKVPNPRPSTKTYIRVTRAGGTGLNAVQSAPTVLIECWAPTDIAAFSLAASAYGRLLDTYGTAVWGGRASLTEPVNFPDPDTSSPRYQFIATITSSLEAA